MKKEAGTWTGYNYINNVKISRCSYGIDIDTNLASVCYFNNCTLAFNGYFGAKLIGVEVGGMKNCDIAGNGQLAISLNEYDETKYGGVYVKGRYFQIESCWHEYNQSKFSEAEVPNDIYIHPDSINVVEKNPRRMRSNVGSLILSESQGVQTRNAYTDTVIDSGMGQVRTQNLITNGSFKYGTSGWLNSNINQAVVTQETVDLPLGYETGLRVVNNTEGVIGLHQALYNPSGNSIIDVTKYIGKTITMVAWIKNLGTRTSLRSGLDFGAIGANVYFTTGNYVSGTPVNQWFKLIITYKITGDEPKLMIGLRSIHSFIVTGFRCQIGDRVLDFEPKPITEDGGNILGNLTINGSSIAKISDVTNNIQVRAASDTALRSATNTLNIDKRHPSFVFNTTTGKMYYSSGSTATSAWRSTDNTGDIVPV